MWNTDIFIRSYIWLIVGAVVLLIFLLVVLLLLNLQILGGRDLFLLISAGPGGLGLQQPDTLAQAHQAGVRPVHNVTLSIGDLGIVVSIIELCHYTCDGLLLPVSDGVLQVLDGGVLHLLPALGGAVCDHVLV